MKGQNHKVNLGSVEDVVDKHISLRKNKTKEKRQEKLRLTRGGSMTKEQLENEIRHLNPENLREFLQKLDKILNNETPSPWPYFGPSDLYPEFSNGPFIFDPKNARIGLLVARLGSSGDKEELELVSNILANFANTAEHGEWVPRLFNFKFLLAVKRILAECPFDSVKTTIIWALANMNIDSTQTRNTILNSDIVPLIMKINDPWGISFFLSSLAFSWPLPPPDVIGPIWNHCVDNYYGKVAEKVDEFILTATNYITRAPGIVYKLEILKVLPKITAKYQGKTNDLPEQIGGILQNITLEKETHQIFFERGLLGVVFLYINDMNPLNRESGSAILTNLAQKPENLDKICTNNFLNAVQRLWANAQVQQIRSNLSWFYINLICIISAQNAESTYYPILLERGFAGYLAEIMENRYDVSLLHNAIAALKLMICWNKKEVWEQFESKGGSDNLDRIMDMPNDIVATAATNLVDNFGLERMEME